MHGCYLDNSATTRPYDEVIQKMKYMMEENYANPSSMHTLGMSAEKELKSARETIAKSIAATPSQIIFTSGGTESDNLAIFGSVEAGRRRGNHVITTAGEHPAVLNCINRLKDAGTDVTVIPLKKGGAPDVDALYAAIRPDTILISMMLVNNELGNVYPVSKVRDMINEKKSKALLHCDAVQGYAKIPFNVSTLGADMITLSSHKIHGPKGVGALYVKEGTRIAPQMFGGGQEGGIRSGTENMQSIAGFAKAAETAFSDINAHIAYLASLRDYAKEKILAGVENAYINTPADDIAPHILNISLPGLRSEVMLHHLESMEIYVSAGSACSARKKGHSHVLSSAGFERSIYDSALRISFGHFNNKDDCDKLVKGLISCRKNLLG